MRTSNMKLEAFMVRVAWGFASSVLLLLLVGLLLLVAGFAGSSFAQGSQPRTFSSPGAATDALFQAAHKKDEQALEAILGAGKEVTSSSDEEQDKLEREQFCQKYQEMHRLVQESDGSTVLYIGAENWPFPVPLVSKNGEWYFDSDRGKQEILFRRIGENETAAIEICQQFAMAKNASGEKVASEDPATQFTESLVSTDASNADNKEPNLFHGYYFQSVTGNSASEASGQGKKKGKSILVAYPAKYKSSGVMTFVVSREGVVYEKDLGPSTTAVAPKIKAATGSGWHPAA
ncbi:MAG: DUF2950 family protein [Candidatus Sulfotelmatobacter sp.]